MDLDPDRRPTASAVSELVPPLLSSEASLIYGRYVGAFAKADDDAEAVREQEQQQYEMISLATNDGMDHPPAVPEFIRTGAATLSLIVTALLSHRRKHGAASSALEPAGTEIGARFDAVIGPGAGFLLLFRAAPLRAPDNG